MIRNTTLLTIFFLQERNTNFTKTRVMFEILTGMAMNTYSYNPVDGSNYSKEAATPIFNVS
jgi:hypothetical protein